MSTSEEEQIKHNTLTWGTPGQDNLIRCTLPDVGMLVMEWG
jgi:hypothetical protein